MNTNTYFRYSLLLIGVVILSLFFLSGCGESGDQSEKEVAYWTCGMHPSVKLDEPGKCPICNMDLVPVYEEGENHAEHEERVEQETEGEIDYWTCGMHPSVRSDEPGKCPICNMDLVPVYKEKHEHGAEEREEETPTLKVSLRARQLAGVEVAEVAYRHLHKQIRTVGQIAYDERRISRVAAWIPGRIDELFIDFTGQKIRKGEPFAMIYSPELVSTQKEYILALDALERAQKEGGSTATKINESMIASTRQRLLLWGISEKEIRRLEKERKVREHITITAPIGGTVVEKTALEGQYVKEGQHLYTVADLSHLWMLADVYEYEMGWIETGQKVTMTSSPFPGEIFEGRITFVDPVLHAQTRSVKVRAELDNPHGRLKPGMFVDVVFDVHLDEDRFQGMAAAFNEHGALLSIPASAALQTGERIVVYQELEEGEYVGRQIEIGPRAGDYYPVLAGLKAGDRVVVRGNFLIDSQTQLTGLESAVYDAALGEKKAQVPGHRH